MINCLKFFFVIALPIFYRIILDGEFFLSDLPTPQNDYALLELEEPIDFRLDFDRAAPACLPTKWVDDGEWV